MKQVMIKMPPLSRGAHLITDLINAHLPDLPESGMIHLFLQHTSAGLCLGENTDPNVLKDLHDAFNRLVPESVIYRHSSEGPDDMPAHIKQTLCGAILMIPVHKGKMALGTWQGIYLFEFRNHGGNRKILATILE